VIALFLTTSGTHATIRLEKGARELG